MKVAPFLDGPEGNAVPGNYLSGLVRQALTIATGQAPIVVGDLVIAGNGVLDIQPGVQLDVALQGGIVSLGGLHLVGEGGTPIALKSHSAQPGADDWRGLIIAGANATLRNVAIEHATTAVTVLSDQVSISDCSLRNFSNWGVDVHGGLVVIEDSHIQGVGKAGVGVFLRTNTDTVVRRNQIAGLERGIDVSPGATPRIETNQISGNAYGIYVGRTNYADPSARPDILNGNQIVDNDYGIYVRSYGTNSWYADHQPRVNDNEIQRNAVYNYHADGFPVTTLLDATRNYWGSDDSSVIRAGISSDQVQYSPFTNSAGEIVYAGIFGSILDEDMRIEPGSTLSLPNGLIIPVGRTLTVAPGVRIEISPGKTIVVNGNIVVETGGAAPVFTVAGGAQNQYWKGFVINAPNQVIHDVTIEQATYGIEVLETSATVRDATFRGCATACIYAHGSYRSGALRKANVLVERVSVELAGSGKGLYYFYANGSVYGSSITGALYGIEVAGSSSVVVRYNTLAGNGRGVYVHSGSSGGVVYDPSVTLNWNNVGQNTSYAFYSEILQVNPGRQMGGQSNWWDTTTAGEIPPKIFDANDGDSRRARLIFDPFSTSTIPLPPGQFGGAAPIATGATYPVSGEGIPNGLARIYVDGSAVADLNIDAQGGFSGAVPIADGTHALYAVNVVNSMESYKSREVQVTIDSTAPVITLVEPVDGIRTNRSVWTVRGQLSESATLTINGQPVTLGPALDFAYGPIALSEALNTLDIVAVDMAGNQAVENVQVTVDSQPPSTIVSDRVSLGPLMDGQLTVTGAPAAADSGAQITVVNARTGHVYTAVASENGDFVLAVGAQPSDTLFMYTTDDLGNQSGWHSVDVPGSAPGLSLNIEQPLQGVSISGSVLNVEGTYTGPTNTSIVVNGVTALLEDGRFYADAVPLEAGSQTITAIANTLAGGVATDAVDVTVAGQALPIVMVNESWGVGDHAVTLDVLVPPALDVTAVEYDFDGNGLMDQSVAPDVPVTHTYNTPGLHVVAGTVRLQSGQSYPFQRHIVVADVQGLHGHLRANWQDFVGQLSAGGVASSMPFIAEEIRAKFESILTANAANLPAMVASLGDVAGFSVTGDVATLTILRNESGRSVAFKVYFLRDDDGLWRISAM